MTVSPSAEIAPSKSTDRILDIDILRGFALFGVLLVNIFYFNAPDAYLSVYYSHYRDPLNMIVMYARDWFFTGKFYPIFSFLFGLGFHIQFVKALQKKSTPYAFLRRRLFLLLLFGLAHIIFVWENDILFIYAIFGFALHTMAERSSKFILRTALVLYVIPIGFEVINNFVHIVPQDRVVSSSLSELVHFYTTASYGQILHQRILNYLYNHSHLEELVSLLDQLAFFLLGLYVGRKNYIVALAKEPRFWFRVFLFAFSVFEFGFLVDKIWLTNLSKLEHPALPLAIQEVVVETTRFFQVSVYIISFLLLLTIPRVRHFVAPLASMGRMAMTGYLMHTIVFSMLFYSYGLRLFGSLAPIQLLMIAIVLYLMLVFLSVFWLNYFQYGPFEWVWRSFTYRKVLPFRRRGD